MNKTYTYTTERQVLHAFWQAHKSLPNITPRRIVNYSGNGKMHNTDTRCAFANYVAQLSCDGEISQDLATRVRLP